MNITFGICSSEATIYYAAHCISSIVDLDIPRYEIIVIGGGLGYLSEWVRQEGYDNLIRIVEFDETPSRWITKKKNVLVNLARYENIVLTHDYLSFHANWWKGWSEFTTPFELATNQILTMEGTRHSDWVLQPYEFWDAVPEARGNWNVALPYDIRGITPVQYIPGNYWIAKTDFMKRYPLDESIIWSPENDVPEDIAWNKVIRPHVEFEFNANATVKCMKPGKWAPALIQPNWLNQLLAHHNLTPRYV
jgi:hypothetical protein